MSNLLRDRRTPLELAERSQDFDFSCKIRDFHRLEQILGADLATLDAARMPRAWRDAEVRGRLSFGFADAQRSIPVLEGRVSATVDAVCQRCLGPLRLPLKVELKLVLAVGPDAARECDGYEVWELDEDRFRPVDIVEECLVMALPLVARHEEDAECREPTEEAPAAADMTKPFASLRSQMEEES